MPTKEVNPFHLHDFDRQLIETLLRPWQPVYFCLQSGAGGILSGIWVFQKAAVSTPELPLLQRNLQQQQVQFMYHHVFLAEQQEALGQQQAWVHALEQGKAWLEAELRNQQSWIQQLEQDKAWLVAQGQEQQAWIRQLEQDKTWLVTQCEQVRQADAVQGYSLAARRTRAWLALGRWLRFLPSWPAKADGERQG